jgi:hypothetical protein
MTFNRFAVGKTIVGVGLAALVMAGLGATPAEARPPSHAPAHGYRSYQSDRRADCDCERNRSRYSRSRYIGSHRDDCRHSSGYSSRYGGSRNGGYGHDSSRYGGSRYGNTRYGAGGANRGPYGDLDRDGRRNYWDRDKDGDGRRNERDDNPKNPRRR